MKASNYVIYIHVPETDEYFLVHGYTGAVDQVSPEVARFLIDRADPAHTWHIKDMEIVRESLQARELDDISFDSIDMLKSRGYLTEMTSAEERLYLERLAGFLHDKRVSSVPPSFMFIPSYECNLRCPYCFESDTRVELSKLKVLQNVLTEKMVDAAYNSMEILINERFAGRSKPESSKESITLYGGEPMMLETLPIVEYIVEKGIERGYAFGAITNAVDLQHYLHLLGPGKIEFLQITLDGSKEIHNRKRIGPRHKEGTYDRIIQNMKLALETGVRISARYHVDFNNVKGTKDLADDLKREDFDQHKNFTMYTYPIHMFHKGLGTPTFPQMAIHHMHREIGKLSDQFMANYKTQVEQQASLPEQDRSKPKVLKVLLPDEGIESKLKAYIKGKLPALFNANMEPCAATTGLYIFDPFGKIYTCWDSVGMAGHETGTYCADGLVLNNMNKSWLSRSPATIEECKDCKYALFHFGGCASLPMGCNGTIFAPACYDFQDNFIYIAQKFFRTGLKAASHKNTVPIHIHEAATVAQAGLSDD